jgi:alkyldihydroxyacetonephosphate synthase
MRRWNGWGDDETQYPLPESASRFLQSALGEGDRRPDATLEEVIRTIPDSRLQDNAWITTDSEARLRHARGQSLPDWLALRSGRIGIFPDGVTYPTSDDDVRKIFKFANDGDAQIIPYGGGTSVVGHINPIQGDKPILTVNLSRMNQLLNLDESSHLATFGAGIPGPEIETELKKHGYTLGHFPQSFELSTLGGWIATRSSGQQSYYYGRIEDLFAGGHVEAPAGSLDLPPHPASAAGPDLRQFILGSEGRMGILTQATVRIRTLPESEHFYGVFFREWEAGMEAVRETVQEGCPLSMLRLSDPQETETTLILSGKERLVELADRGLNILGYGEERCLLIFGVTGDDQKVSQARRQASPIFRSHGGLPAISMIGEMWRKSRFYSPYLRNTLWDSGYAIDTLETAVPWSTVASLHMGIKNKMLQAASSSNQRILIFAHLSHMYQDGASIYVTFLFPRAPDPEDTLLFWRRLKERASQTIVEAGGTISHQHGVGLDHAPYLEAEKGHLGIDVLNAVCKTLDPKGILNPGKLLTTTGSTYQEP